MSPGKRRYTWRRRRWHPKLSIDPRLRLSASNAVESARGEKPVPKVKVIAMLRSSEVATPDAIEAPIRRGATVTGSVAPDRLAELRSSPGVRSVKRSVVLRRALDDATMRTIGMERGRATRQRASNPSGVLLGVIDFNCAPLHPAFQRADQSGTNQTRFLSIWDQTQSGPPPAGFGYGREIDAATLNRCLTKLSTSPGIATRLKLEKEDLGMEPQVPDDHGSSVLALAGGSDGVAPECDLIFVRLPEPAGDGATTSQLVDAIHYILEKSAPTSRKGASAPVVIVISLECNSGPHDGTGPVERLMDEVCTIPGRAIVLAAGNQGNQRNHAGGVLASSGQITQLEFECTIGRLSTNSTPVEAPGGMAEIDVWYDVISGRIGPTPRSADSPRSPLLKIELELTELDGNQVSELEIDGPGAWQLSVRGGPGGARRTPVADVVLREGDPLNGSNELRISTTPGALPNGARLKLLFAIPRDNSVDVRARVDAWVDAESPREFCQFQPSRTRPAPARTERSISSLACGLLAISVGSVESAADDASPADVDVAAMSSFGPTRGPSERSKPDLSAPGVAVQGIAEVGSLDDGEAALDGTSFSAPLVGGIIARLYAEALPQLVPIDVLRALLLGSCVPPTNGHNIDQVGVGVARLDGLSAGGKLWRHLMSKLRDPAEIERVVSTFDRTSGVQRPPP